MARKLLALAALSVAVIDLGNKVRETPRFSNRGVRVDEYLRTAGVAVGSPYCASAVYTWFVNGAKSLGIHVPLVQTGYCPTLAAWGKSSGRARASAADAQPGDIIVYWMQVRENGKLIWRFAHTGLVRENRGHGTLITVEANTNDDGSRDGDGVYQKVRVVTGTKHMVIDMQAEGVDISAPVAPKPTLTRPAPVNLASPANLAAKAPQVNAGDFKHVYFGDVVFDGVLPDVHKAMQVNIEGRVYIAASLVRDKSAGHITLNYADGRLHIKQTA